MCVSLKNYATEDVPPPHSLFLAVIKYGANFHLNICVGSACFYIYSCCSWSQTPKSK